MSKTTVRKKETKLQLAAKLGPLVGSLEGWEPQKADDHRPPMRLAMVIEIPGGTMREQRERIGEIEEAICQYGAIIGSARFQAKPGTKCRFKF